MLLKKGLNWLCRSLGFVSRIFVIPEVLELSLGVTALISGACILQAVRSRLYIEEQSYV